MIVRPPPSRLATAAAALILATAFLAGCDNPAPSPASPAAQATPNPSVDPATCALEVQPGPNDPVPGGGDLIDVDDLGNARVRLCLAGQAPIEVEGSALCTWNDDRTAVEEVSLPPTEIAAGGADGGFIDGGVVLAESSVYIGVTGDDGLISTFGSRELPQTIDPAPDGTSGAAQVRLAATVDPENPPAVRPTDLVGVLRWACGDPPPPRPGRSAGRVTLHLDAPIARTWEVDARCDWVTTSTGPQVRIVETDPPDITYDGRLLAPTIGITNAGPDGVSVNLWVDTGEVGDFYSSGFENLIQLGRAANGSSGVLRMRHLTIEPASDVRITGDVVDAPGVLRWNCPAPAAPGPKEEMEPEETELHPGTARLTFTPPVVAPLDGPITCIFDRSNPDYLLVSELRGSLPAPGGGWYELRTGRAEVVMAVVSADGQPAGEYVGQIDRIGDQADAGPLLIDVLEFEFEPVDPAYVPLGGRDGPRSVGLLIDYECELGES